MVVRTSRWLVATLACVWTLHASACSDVQHVVGKADLSATGGTGAPRAGSGAAASASTGGGGAGGIPLGGAFAPFDASLPDAMPECTSVIATEPRRLNLYLVIDRTVAQLVLVAWPTVVEGIQAYVRMPQAEGIGVGYDLIGIPLAYPNSDPMCELRDFRTPFVGIAREPLPNNVGTLEAGLEGWDTPFTSLLLPAMDGALWYVRSVRDSYKEKHAIVLITDSIVDRDQCGSTVASVAGVAAEAFADGIPTHVIENIAPLENVDIPVVDELLTAFADLFAQLDPIAAAGGTTQARRLAVGNDLSTMLLDIQRAETPRCEYAMPAGYAWDQLQLAIDDGFGPRPFPRLDSSSDCAPNGGVYLDTQTGFAKACASTCSAIGAIGVEPIWVNDCEPNGALP